MSTIRIGNIEDYLNSLRLKFNVRSREVNVIGHKRIKWDLTFALECRERNEMIKQLPFWQANPFLGGKS